ncbi:putative secreted protein with PEP-CTERM sorting signal [Nitrosospira multiformis]|uniref:Putative secreted protein with PEP-CTERM sorting signal n=1 Tax=Nitrosospira multiformis TaxID=1231 RepID=A0A2T5I6W2_9PROT|nr:DVUA0089 family protein [Nitrosospira multiformis]PTQ79574.1 putative secreted protein with PEP-CTERM sorting signal [Nitrosospira multiformis]
MKLNAIHFKKITVSVPLFTLALLANPAHAVDWTEIGDAGQLVSTAQMPTGDEGRLRNIYGTISTNNDVDLFRIYISNPTTFSAGVSSTSGNLDSGLILFNEGGYALYGNDDAMLGTRVSSLPADHVNGPQAAGWYNLAIFALGTPPVSGDGFTPDHYMFPNVSSPYTQILTATGPGGASPLTGWAQLEDTVALNEDYRIRLSGVTVSPVPEPETYAMLLAGLGLMGTIVRRRKGVIG